MTPDCGTAPSLRFDQDGVLWAVYAGNDHVWLSRSLDAGQHFEPPVRVNENPEPLYASGENRPVLAFGEDAEIFVAWTRKLSGPFNGDVRFARSSDGGQQFSTPRTINDDGLHTSHRFVNMQQDADGTLYLAWLDKRDREAALARGEDYVGAALYYSWSNDGGHSFSPNRLVAANSCECCRLGMAAADNGGVRVLWRHTFQQNKVRDHAIATLRQGQVEGLRRATLDDWHLDGCPHHGPALASSEAGDHMVWFTLGTQRQGIHYALLPAEGGAPRQGLKLDDTPGSGHPAIALDGSEVHLVWQHFDGEAMQLLWRHSPDGGKTWASPHSLARTSSTADHPALLCHDRRCYAAWHTAEEGLRVIPLATQRQDQTQGEFQ